MFPSVQMPKPGIHLKPAIGIFIATIALYAPDSLFAALPRSPDNTFPGMAKRVCVVVSPCAKLPFPCNVLCQEAVLLQSRAAILEETATATRSKADMAKKRAEYFQNLADKKTLEAQRLNKKVTMSFGKARKFCSA